MIIHINGWPGVGKLTVARVLAQTLGARLLDNHTLHDVPGRLCERNTEEYWRLYYRVRAVAYDWVRAMPADQVLVMTNALLTESEREQEAWLAVKQLAASRSDTLVAITLDCTLDENTRRIQSDDRRFRKLVDVEPLIEWRSQYTLLTDSTVPTHVVDNSALSPEEAASQIAAFVRDAT